MLQITLIPFTIPFKRPARTSRGALAARDLWLVACADDGAPETRGLGECGPIPGLSADHGPTFARAAAALVHAINGAALPAPTTIDALAQIQHMLTPWAAQLAQLPSLRFGLESAMLDLAQGGRGLLFDSAFARGAAGLPTHGLIWMDAPAGLNAQIDAKVAAGFTVIKMKVGALPFDEELALLRDVRARYPQITLRLDANGAFAPDVALARLVRLAPIGVEFIEQPLPAGNAMAMAALCAQSPIPIALDEELIGLRTHADIRRLLADVQPQGVIIKPALLGGWTAAQAVAELCTQFGIAWWANSLLESSVGHDAICQWTATYGGARIHGLGTGSLFEINFPSPIRLAGATLRRDQHLVGRDRGVIVH